MNARHGCRTLLCALLLVSSRGEATIYRCTASDGHITLSDNHCQPDQQEQAIQDLHINRIPPPVSAPGPSPAAGSSGMRLITSGQRSDGCGDLLDSRARRRAIVEQHIYQGMPKADVERALGEPDEISGSDSRTRYHYQARAGRKARTISFDQQGCVLGRKKSTR